MLQYRAFFNLFFFSLFTSFFYQCNAILSFIFLGVKLIVLGCGGLVGSRLSSLLIASTDIFVSPTVSMPLRKIVLFDLKEPQGFEKVYI